MFRVLFALPRTIWILGLISLFNDATSELVYPLLPIYLGSVLMAGPRLLGLIEGIAETTASLLKLFSGWIADHFGRYATLISVGYGLGALSRPLFSLASSWPLALGLRFADRLGKGLRTSPRDALLARSVDTQHTGLAFGLHRAMDNAGAVIGPLCAAYLLAIGLTLKDIFTWTILPGLITVALALSIPDGQSKLNKHKTQAPWFFSALPSPFKRYLLVLLFFTIGNSSNMFLLLRAKELGIAEYQIPLLWALTSIFAAAFSTPLSALSDIFGRRILLLSGWAIYAIFYFTLGSADMPADYLWPLFAFYGLYLAATEGTEKAFVADLARPDQLGTAYGWFHLTTGVMLLPASVLFGWLWQSAGPSVAFYFCAGAAFISSFLLLFWVKSPKNVSQHALLS